ncbi:4Fe-4S binding protein [Pseudodesulfovibrio methanolicus]|uniref:4Fe-4S binding protein n=1 Tax=Pseudodesulfovibrio methanolicus TaxID=3126690 RepID=A0ABZ2IYX2_9BACT
MQFTPTVIKNLLKKPATRKYPYEVREPFPMYRGELVIDIDRCIFCGMCSRKCPSQCITVDKAAGTWQCDPHACVYCGLCRDHCPTKCLSMKDVHRKPVTEKVTWIEHGNPPKPKVKAAPKAEAKAEAKPGKKADKKDGK